MQWLSKLHMKCHNQMRLARPSWLWRIIRKQSAAEQWVQQDTKYRIQDTRTLLENILEVAANTDNGSMPQTHGHWEPWFFVSHPSLFYYGSPSCGQTHVKLLTKTLEERLLSIVEENMMIKDTMRLRSISEPGIQNIWGLQGGVD